MPTKLTLVLAALWIATCAIAQPFGGTYTLPSRVYQSGAIDDIVSFATPVLLDPMSSTYPNFGNPAYSFFIDTNFVDMEFTKAGSTYHVSDAINSTAAKFSLVANGYVTGALETGGEGAIVGIITRQGSVGTSTFEVDLAVEIGTAMNFTSPMANLVVCADGTLLRFMTHPSAIISLPTHSYQIAPNTPKSTLRCGLTPSSTGNGPLVMVGGAFTVVPEPATIAAIGGTVFLVRLRRKVGTK